MKIFFHILVLTLAMLPINTFGQLNWYGDPDKGSTIFNNLNFEGGEKHSKGSGSIKPAIDSLYGKIWRVYKPSEDRRSEIRGAAGWSYHEGKGGSMKQEVPYYIGWRYKFEMPNKETGDWACFQWKSYPDPNNPNSYTQNYPIHMSYNGRNLELTKHGPGWQEDKTKRVKIWSQPVKIGTWVDIVLVINPSIDEKIGYVEIYFNGEQQTLLTGGTRVYHKTMDGLEVAPKWGCYNNASIGTEVTVDLADLRIGRDLASVIPKPVSDKRTTNQIDFEKEFESMSKLNWQEIFFDDGTKNWEEHWIQDGKKGSIKNTPKGMDYASGTGNSDNDHEVIWTKEIFKGNLKIEYDFTRLDTNNTNVCIIYVQATGAGTEDFPTDIMKWKSYRAMPKMSYYFNNMNTFHVSYAVNKAGYVRARRYPILPNKKWDDTKIPPLYSGEGLFETNKTCHLTIIKKGTVFLMEVKGDGKRELYGWDTSSFDPITEGRIGLRQMFQRRSLYANFKVATLD